MAKALVGVIMGSFIWVVASLVMSLWTFWFGLGLALTAASQRSEIEPIAGA